MLTPTDKHRLWHEAAGKYLRGEITPEEWWAAKKAYGIDYLAASKALAEMSMRREAREALAAGPRRGASWIQRLRDWWRNG